MKKLFPLLLLFTGIVNAQTINIPDPNFKGFLLASGSFSGVLDQNLNPVTLDVNFDGEIDQSEALLAYYMDISMPTVTSLEGIEYFTNLLQLNCSNMMGLTSLNVSTLTNLWQLDCSNNQLMSLDVSNHTNLINLYCSGNWTLETLNISNCPALMNLWCTDNMLTVLDVSGKPNLRSIYCEYNNIGALDLSVATQLQYLSCRNNMITALDLTNAVALTDLNCGENLLTSLDVSHCPNLVAFHCTGQHIPTLDLSSNPHLTNLNLRYCDISSIDLSGLTELTNLNLDGNHYTTLDVSNSPHLCLFSATNSNTLTSLFMKNGPEACYLEYHLSGNPNLQYACTDDNRILHFINYFGNNGMPNVNVNSYCSFVPGGVYNTITGTAKFDADNNGCDAADPNMNYLKMNFSDGTNSFSGFTSDGAYKFFTQAGDFTVTPAPEDDLSWFTFSPPNAVVNFATADGLTSVNNFCVTPNGLHPDVETVISATTALRPGFTSILKITYRNKGNQVTSGNITFGLPYPQLQFVVSAPLMSGFENNWTHAYNDLQPFESRSIYVTVHVNAPTDTPPVNLGDALDFASAIQITTPVAADENIDDNTYELHATAVGSFDPNSISCLEGSNVAPSAIGKYLHYEVKFENTGNYDAENIVVRDSIDTDKFDIGSLQVMSASHGVYTRVNGNVVEFIFEGINLPPSEDNLVTATPPIGGHGNVLFKIRSRSALVAGDSVENTANIYFDYNFPVETNEAVTTFNALIKTVFVKDNSVTVYPNPARDKVSISANSSLKSIEMYDVQGRVLQTQLENKNNTTLDISGRQSGIYFLKITSEKGSSVEKLVKE